jgi:hypothetical protein
MSDRFNGEKKKQYGYSSSIDTDCVGVFYFPGFRLAFDIRKLFTCMASTGVYFNLRTAVCIWFLLEAVPLG